MEVCQECNGKGKISKKRCTKCLGFGKEKKNWTELECEGFANIVAHDILEGAIRLGYQLSVTNEYNVKCVTECLKNISKNLKRKGLDKIRSNVCDKIKT